MYAIDQIIFKKYDDYGNEITDENDKPILYTFKENLNPEHFLDLSKITNHMKEEDIMVIKQTQTKEQK